MICILKESKKDNKFNDFFDKHGIKLSKDIYKNPIGFSEKEQKWYGWSHRAIYGFKIGDKCKAGELGVGDEYTFKPGDKLQTLDDCKKRALDFAKAAD